MNKKPSTMLVTLILGACTALTLFSSDIYIPALTQIASDLHSSAAQAQMSVTIAMAGVALGLVIFGSMSDVIGRKKTLQLGIALFMLSTVICFFAPSMPVFLGARFIAGFGVAAAQVAAASVPFDMFKGEEASKMVSKVVMVVSVSPIIAPIIGQALIANFGWRSCFLFLLVWAGMSLALVTFKLPESLAKEFRQKANVNEIANGYWNIFKNVKTISLLLCGAVTYGMMFLMITNCPFLVKNYWGFSDAIYLAVYSFISIGSICGGLVNINLLDKFGRRGMLRIAIIGEVIIAVAGVAVALVLQSAMMAQMIAVVALLFIMMGLCPIVNPNITGLIVDKNTNAVGAANALVSVMQNIGAAIFAPIAFSVYTSMGGTLSTNSPVSLPVVVMIAALIFAAITFVTATFGAKESESEKATSTSAEVA